MAGDAETRVYPRPDSGLREGELFDLAFNGAELGAWEWDLATRVITLSSRWAELRGFSRSTNFHPDDLPVIETALRDHLEGNSPQFECECRLSANGEKSIWILARGKVSRWDAQGTPTRIAGVALDMTARKLAEDALRRSEATFHGIVSTSADAIVSADKDMRIAVFNGGAEALYGYTHAEVIGKSVEKLIPERFRKGNLRAVERIAAGPSGAWRLRRDIIGLRRTGEEFAAEGTISKLVIDNELILTIVLRDVTEQRRIERGQRLLAELAEAVSSDLEFKNRFVAIARLLSREMADVCIIDVVDEDDTTRGAYVACRNPAKQPVCDVLSRRRLGSTEYPFTGSPVGAARAVVVQNLTPKTISSWASNELDRAILENAGFTSAIVAPLWAYGRRLGVITLLAAGSPQRYVQRDARIIEAFVQPAAIFLDNARLFAAATRASKLRDEMLGVVAHDLRNPLAAIVTLAAVLRRTGADEEVVTEIEHAAKRMSRLIQDIVDVTRLEAGRFTLEQARLSANELLSEALEEQRQLASASSLECLLDAGTAVPDIWADHDRLLQVFENLVGNAIKFTKPGGRITLGVRAREGDVLFWVADTGRGIEPDQLAHVFDRFWQAPGAKRRGAGLGLPIVKGIVETHGGQVWVESTSGQGSTFFFTVPVGPASGKSPV